MSSGLHLSARLRHFKRYVEFILRDRKLLAESDLFIAEWYRNAYPDVSAAGVDPLRHYALKGGFEARAPGPGFDSEFYLSANPDVSRARFNPLIHYLRFGRREGRIHRPLLHTPTTQAANPDAALIAASGLFDEAWYLAMYPDVARSGVDPLTHYLESGGHEGRASGPRFDSAFYLRAYPDVAADGVNPLVHYLTRGKIEGRRIRMWSAEAQAISESGLFDPHWYRSKYPEVSQNGMDPLEHYLERGMLQNYAPGPLFDPADFLKRHPDFEALGRRPIMAFLHSPPGERRQAQSVFCEPELDRWGPCRPIPVLRSSGIRPSIAVSVHVFYIDVFEEICGYLKNLPYHFNLLVTTPDERYVQAVPEIVERVALDATVFVKLCQNRGRNFGPLLVEFASLLQRHDLFLHLHTKKSPHNGSAADDWRSYLYRSLVGSKYLINGLIELFEDPGLGVVYPSTHSWLPYWAHHWLSNSHLATSFYERIGIPYTRPLEYIDYPVGSMFWARTRALSPLFEAGWRYDDFPAEAGQRDGTVAHVIERSIVEIAKSEGFRAIEMDYEKGSLRQGWSRKNLHQYSRRRKQDLYDAIDAADVVSFDIFDTLVTRPVLTPDALLQYIGWRIARATPELCDFFDVRKRAEIRSREQKHFAADVNIDEIYREFPTVSAWPPQAAVLAKSLELECELRTFQRRDDLVEAAKYAKSRSKRVIAVSDTYFQRSFIEELLANIGLRDVFDEIYLSSRQGARKDRGDMWAELKEIERLDSKRMLHIGDNEQSDAQLPGDRAIGIFHVMSPASLLVNTGIPVSAKRNWSADLLLGPLAVRRFNSPFVRAHRFRPLFLPSAEELGYTVFGPLLFAFFSWLFTHPAIPSLSKLYFLSREGFFLHKLFQKLRELLPDTTPSASYLYASRRAALAAAQAVCFDPAQITFGSGFRGTVSDLLKVRLGLVLPKDFGLEDTEIVLPEDVEYVHFILNVLRSRIIDHGVRELSFLRRYSHQMGMSDSEAVGIVDIGYSGSIQNALQTALERPLSGFYLATTKDVFRVEAKGGFAFGCYADGETFAATRTPVLRHCRILESFLTAPHGQVLRFEPDKTGNLVIPVFKSQGLSQAAFHVLSNIYRGVTHYFDDLIDAFGVEVVFTDPDLNAAQGPLKALVNHDILLPREIADALYLEDDFCGNAELRAGDLAVAPQEYILPA